MGGSQPHLEATCQPRISPTDASFPRPISPSHLLLVHKLAPIQGGQGEMEERGSHSRWEGGRLNKQETCIPGSSWFTRQVHPCTRPKGSSKFIVRPYQGSVRDTNQMVSTTQTVSRLRPWEPPHGGDCGKHTHSKDRGQGEEPPIPRSRSQANQRSRPFCDLLLRISLHPLLSQSLQISRGWEPRVCFSLSWACVWLSRFLEYSGSFQNPCRISSPNLFLPGFWVHQLLHQQLALCPLQQSS